jgi:hypothetical protein
MRAAKPCAWTALSWAVLLAASSGASCRRVAYREAPGVGLEVPLLPGWALDDTIAPDGRTVLRLVRAQAVTGSPRIDVLLDPPAGGRAELGELLERSLREIAALERAGTIRIDGVEQRPVHLGPHRAYRLHHEYVLTSSDVGVTQDSVLVILSGRAVAVTAVGRTELFTPLRSDIETVLRGLRSPAPPESSVVGDAVDLGKLGGKE